MMTPVCSVGANTIFTALIRGPWSAWSSCSASCDGTHERTRSCHAEPGETCDGLTSESRSCNGGICSEYLNENAHM